MSQTWSRNCIWMHARHEPFYDQSLIFLLRWWSYVLDLYLYPCMLSNPCRYLDKPNSMRLQLTHILSNLYITKSLLHGGWKQGSIKPFNISFDKFYVLNFMIVILDTQVLFLANLTHVGRWTQTTRGAPNTWWTTSSLSIQHKFDYMIKINTTTQGMLFHLREALPQDMGQSSSTRCEYIKMLKRKMVTPFWA